MTTASHQTVVDSRSAPLYPALNNFPLHAIKDPGEISDLKNEISHWFSPVNMYVYLWQPVQLRNYLLTRNRFFKSSSKLPHFKNLWKNICKGSFAYNTFLFKKPVFSSASNNTFLADLTCLALLFGDEFIDGLCMEAGKPDLQQLLDVNGGKFYLQIKNEKHPELQYGFDLYQLLPAWIWTRKNNKYGITYAAFYELLKELLELMNSRLKKLSTEIAISVAVKIKEACDLCFDTFIHDVNDGPVQHICMGNMQPAMWHDKKNIAIQEKLLELRCLLLNKPVGSYQSRFKGWTDIISTMQVYDDMQDCRTDDHYQDNLLLAIATQSFPDEMTWFHENKNKRFDDHQWRLQVSMNMPCSVYLCTKFVKQKMMNKMCWTQKKICNYLWKQNWFRPGKQVVNEDLDFFCHEERLKYLFDKTFSVHQLTSNENEWKAFTLEIAFHDRQLSKYILSKSGWKERYFIHFNFLQMNSYEKAGLLNRVLASQTKSVYE